jgi:hypothetical protein
MNSITLRSQSTRCRVALVVVVCEIALFITANTAVAQQQPQAAQPQVPITQLQSPLSVTLTQPGRDLWDNLSQIVAPLGTLVGLVAAIITVGWSVRSWKLTYFTKEWSALMKFVQPQAKFMDCKLTAEYETSFKNDDAMKYEMIARLCIGYLDDLYFMGSKRKLRKWFRGSVKLFAGTHREWLKAHEDSYDPKFYQFIMRQLDNDQ